MNERLSLLYSRRSIRKFKTDPLPEDTVAELLKAAMAAPSAKNLRPWHFLVLTEQADRDALADAHPYAAFAREAPLAIVVFGEQVSELYFQDLAAATQNILLAATGLGLGSCWCGVNEERRPRLHNITGIPRDMPIASVVVVGHPAEDKEARTQYDASRVHQGRYSG
jgi:nitroreductase